MGRVAECEQIARARAEGILGVIVHAGAGVGKSRLARAALEQSERDGTPTAWVTATHSAAAVPLGAFAGVIPAEIRSDDRFGLLRASAEAIHELGGRRQLVLGVDDAQRLDPTSAALVLHLASTGIAFVVATVRSGESCPDAIVSLWKDAGALRLELQLLSEPETGRLVEAIVGGPVEQRAQRWIWDSSRGNALYVSELVRGARSGGALAPLRGLWQLDGVPSVTGSLAELITARMTGLSDLERRALELLALGEPLRLSELFTLAGKGSVLSLEERGLVTVDAASAAGAVRMAHPLYGETIRSALPTLRAHDLRMQLAATLQARDEITPDDCLRVARWLLDAGEPLPTQLLVAAARTANLSGDPDLGAKLAKEALERDAGIEAALLLARAHVARNRFEEAASVLAEAESAIASQDEALAYLEHQVAVLYHGLSRTEGLRELVTRAADWWPDEIWQRRLAPMGLMIGSFRPADAPGLTVTESAKLLQEQDLEPQTRRRLEQVQLSGLFYSGQGSQAYALARKLLPPLSRRDLAGERIFALWSGIAAETGEGWHELEQVATQTMSNAVRLEDRGALGVAALALGSLRFCQGRFRDARRWLAEAEQNQERHDPVGLLAITTSLHTGVACYTADADGACAALGRCRRALRGEQPLPNQLPYLICAEAWSAKADGDAALAWHGLLDGADRVSAMPLYAARLTYEAMRLGAPVRTVAPALIALNERCDARLVAAQAAHGAARDAADGQALLVSADQLEGIGALRFACEAAAHAAQVFVNAGREDSARRAATRSRELFVVGQDGLPPPIEGLDHNAVQLTPRETQLVELAAQGLSNAGIAEQLVLSVRTVESHLYRAMQKLGVDDRRELEPSR